MNYTVLHSRETVEELYADLENKSTDELLSEYERIAAMVPTGANGWFSDKSSDIAANKLLGMIARILNSR